MRSDLVLLGLAPRAAREHDPEVATAEIYRRLEQVSAWCRLAVAEGWDSGRISRVSPQELPFEPEVRALTGYAGGRAVERVREAEELVRAAESRPEVPGSPWRALAEELGLSDVALDVLAVLVAPTLLGELARIYAVIAADNHRPLCDGILVAQVLAPRHPRFEVLAALAPQAPLCRAGLIIRGKGNPPFQELRPDPLVVRRLLGESFDRADPDEPIEVVAPTRSLDEIIMAPAALTAVVAALGEARGQLRLVLRGRPGSGRRTLLATLCAGAGRRLASIEPAALGDGPEALETLRRLLRSAALRGWIPCVGNLDAFLATQPHNGARLREALRGHPGPVVLRVAPETTVPADPGNTVVDVDELDEGERGRAWTAALSRRGLPVDLAATLASRCRGGPGLAERAVGDVRLPAGDLRAELDSALRRARGERLGTLATRITRLAAWSDLVMPREVLDSVRELLSRARNRRRVMEEWGFERVASTACGLTALFQGGPGTGKTMIAGVIARALGAELYRVDLSRILSKWIGETERNLASLFDAADDGETVLLFDEADALFARRTEVKSSNDRFANAQVNYLLQRLDSFAGIAVLTTNHDVAIDPAFKRRLTLCLGVPFPDAEQRAQLWRAHIPPAAPVEGTLDLDGLATKYALAGGIIRNAALRAAFLAAEEGTSLSQAHLERAVTLVYRDQGRLSQGSLS